MTRWESTRALLFQLLLACQDLQQQQKDKTEQTCHQIPNSEGLNQENSESRANFFEKCLLSSYNDSCMCSFWPSSGSHSSLNLHAHPSPAVWNVGWPPHQCSHPLSTTLYLLLQAPTCLLYLSLTLAHLCLGRMSQVALGHRLKFSSWLSILKWCPLC